MKERWNKHWQLIQAFFTTNILLLGIVLLVAWPLLLWIMPYFSHWNLPILGSYFGYFIVFFALIVMLVYVVKRIKSLIYVLLGLALFGFGISTIAGKYGYKDITKDYFALVSDLQNQSQLVSVMSSDYEPFVDAIRIRELISVRSSSTRNFAVKTATKHFQDKLKNSRERKLFQYMSVFKEINANWVYVEDPEGEEYFASPDETIEYVEVDGKFSGDCDDHAILMAACLKFIGGKVRLVRTPTHIYPELKIADKQELDRMVQLIRSELFINESYGNSIFYHTDPEGNIWLNFDYTNKYPGGKFLDDKIVGILEV